jgi:Uma2 family endonuclease
MVSFNYPTPQTDPQGSPKETLPTMYDLPSEYPEERGKPDEFHDWQAQLLSLTFCPPHYPLSQIFYASDLNIYYDVALMERLRESGIDPDTFFQDQG